MGILDRFKKKPEKPTETPNVCHLCGKWAQFHCQTCGKLACTEHNVVGTDICTACRDEKNKRRKTQEEGRA